METTATKRNRSRFVKYHLGLSYILSPAEARFMMHMDEIDHLEQLGFKTDFTRRELMKRMGLGEHTFDSAVRSLLAMGLIVRGPECSRNRVSYSLDRMVYGRLVIISSATRNINRLMQFFDTHLRKDGRSIASITDQEIEELKIYC